MFTSKYILWIFATRLEVKMDRWEISTTYECVQYCSHAIVRTLSSILIARDECHCLGATRQHYPGKKEHPSTCLFFARQNYCIQFSFTNAFPKVGPSLPEIQILFVSVWSELYYCGLFWFHGIKVHFVHALASSTKKGEVQYNHMKEGVFYFKSIPANYS